MAPAGHNANGQIKSIIERIEALEASKADISSDIRDVYAEAKGNGYDVGALRVLVRERKQDSSKLAEKEAILDTYRHALGMLSDLPLGRAALERAAS